MLSIPVRSFGKVKLVNLHSSHLQLKAVRFAQDLGKSIFHGSSRSRRGIAIISRQYQPASSYVAAFREILGAENVMTEAIDIEKYTIDWTTFYRGGSVVCFPRSTRDVSNILKFCNENKIGVVPQGGNTGLVGGAVGLPGESGNQLIMSMEKMKAIYSIDEGVLVCDAGCILENLNTECAKKGYVVPLDLGSKGACMIGGNVATNAGGLRVLKYGSMHANILGLEVVQADGTVLNMLRTLKKDNCGYHLPHLFIGSEGTLGVITKVAISLAMKPTSTAVVWAKVSCFSVVSKLLQRAKTDVGEILSAFEFIDGPSLQAVKLISPHLMKRIQSSVLPISHKDQNLRGRVTEDNNIQIEGNNENGINGEICVLMEFNSTAENTEKLNNNSALNNHNGEEEGGGVSSGLNQRLERFLENILEDGLVVDAVVSQNIDHENELWAMRELVPVCLMQLTRVPLDCPILNLEPISSFIQSPLSSSSLPLNNTTVLTDCSNENEHKNYGNGGLRMNKKVIQYNKLFKYDVSISLSETDKVVLMIKKYMEKEIEVIMSGRTSKKKNEDGVQKLVPFGRISLEFCCFGHAGDSNLHLNILLKYPTEVEKNDNVLGSMKSMTRLNEIDDLNGNQDISERNKEERVNNDDNEYRRDNFNYENIENKDNNNNNNNSSIDNNSSKNKIEIKRNNIETNYINIEEMINIIQILLNKAVYTSVLSVNGSVSAEHGVGQQKKEIMIEARSKSELVLMGGIKNILDPHGILNPGKVLPDGYQKLINSI